MKDILPCEYPQFTDIRNSPSERLHQVTSKLLTSFKTVRFYSGSLSALCLLIPWSYILSSLLLSPYAASNMDSLDPG